MQNKEQQMIRECER